MSKKTGIAVGAATVSDALPDLPRTVAVMLALPADIPVTTPAEETDAIDGFEELHESESPDERKNVARAASSSVAVACVDCPAVIAAGLNDTVIDVSVGPMGLSDTPASEQAQMVKATAAKFRNGKRTHDSAIKGPTIDFSSLCVVGLLFVLSEVSDRDARKRLAGARIDQSQFIAEDWTFHQTVTYASILVANPLDDRYPRMHRRSSSSGKEGGAFILVVRPIGTGRRVGAAGSGIRRRAFIPHGRSPATERNELETLNGPFARGDRTALSKRQKHLFLPQ